MDPNGMPKLGADVSQALDAAKMLYRKAGTRDAFFESIIRVIRSIKDAYFPAAEIEIKLKPPASIEYLTAHKVLFAEINGEDLFFQFNLRQTADPLVISASIDFFESELIRDAL
ncbi:MAG TPA: hypothetical protein VKK79_08850, partial [Candidatus Lokiarchaeia archaeon]|nr:hypothetical protein [Candidatus Lokiarchaeia archaeon]